MKNVKSMDQFLNEQDDSLLEKNIMKVDILLDGMPDDVMDQLSDIEGLSDLKPTNFGVIKAKANRQAISAIKKMKGIQDVETY